MGEMKQLLPWKGKTIIEAVIDNLSESKINEIVVVLGYNSYKIINFINNRNINIAINENYKDGMFSSIKLGLFSLSNECKSFMIVLGDQPHITSNTINAIVDEYLKRNKGIISPVFKGKKGHPIIFNIKYKGKIMELDNNSTLRDIIRNNNDDLFLINVDDRGVIEDIDKKEDYLKCL